MNASKWLPLAGGMLVLASAVASAQETAPALPGSWLNDPGFTNEGAKGKVLFLVFYEET